LRKRKSGLIGLWKDRYDIRYSAAYAPRLREQAQKRGDIDYDFAGSDVMIDLLRQYPPAMMLMNAFGTS